MSLISLAATSQMRLELGFIVMLQWRKLEQVFGLSNRSKAPDPDGLHAGFYQHFWMEVKNSVCEEIKEIFMRGVVSSYLNETLIALIPKCQNPESLSNYRPFNLCNLIYKVISKIIVARIRPHLSSLISPVQTAFVPG